MKSKYNVRYVKKKRKTLEEAISWLKDNSFTPTGGGCGQYMFLDLK